MSATRRWPSRVAYVLGAVLVIIAVLAADTWFAPLPTPLVVYVRSLAAAAPPLGDERPTRRATP